MSDPVLDQNNVIDAVASFAYTVIVNMPCWFAPDDTPAIELSMNAAIFPSVLVDWFPYFT